MYVGYAISWYMYMHVYVLNNGVQIKKGNTIVHDVKQ